jgi:CHAT domain-containing protein
MIFCCNSGVQANLPDQPTYLASLQRKVEQILLDIKNLSYVQAAELLQSLKQELWPCHKTTPLQLWIDVHLCHVLLRAAVASLSNTESFLFRAFQGFTTCIDKPFYYSSFVRTLKVSACLGRAWMHLLKGEIDEAQQDIRNSEGYSMDSTALATRTTHANWAMAASCFMAGDLGGVEDFLKKVGYDIESLTDMYQIGAMDCQVLRMKGSFNDAVTMSAQLVLRDNPFNDKDTMPISTCKRMRQLQLGVIGNIWFALGAYMEAMQYYREASSSDDLLLRASGLVGEANVHMRLCKPGFEKQAEGLYTKALDTYKKLQYLEGKVVVYCNLGSLHLMQGLLPEALKCFRLAKALSCKVRLQAALVEIDCRIAQVHVRLNQWDKAMSLLKQSQEFVKEHKEPLVQAWIEHHVGLCLLTRSEGEKGRARSLLLDKAETHLISAIKYFCSAQCYTTGKEKNYERLWIMLFEGQKETYALLQWCLACNNKDLDAIVWGERSRSRALVWERWNEVLKVTKEQTVQLDPAITQKLELDEFDKLSCDAAWDCIKGWNKMCTLPDAVIIQYTICVGFGLLIYVLNSSSKANVFHQSFRDLGKDICNSDDIDNLVNKTLEVLQLTEGYSKVDEEKYLTKLYDILIRPVEKVLQKAKQLIIIPHETLHKVPFAALMDNQRQQKGRHPYLIEQYIVSCTDSIRSMVRSFALYKSRPFHSSTDDQGCATLVIGIKDHRSVGETNLSYAEEEANEVVKILKDKFGYNQAKAILGSNATKEMVKHLLPKARLVHFATHATVTDKYEEGAILFAKPDDKATTSSLNINVTSRNSEVLVEGDPLLGLMQSDAHNEFDVQQTMTRFQFEQKVAKQVVLVADEIAGMNLKAQLVVLSACQTGQGVVAGEGVAGLGRALTRAGVPCTVLSLWSVDDNATKSLMVAFYEKLCTFPVAAAMQEAMVHMIKEPNKADPLTGRWKVKHWAAFVPFGLPSALG